MAERNRKEQRLARQRMVETGENYTTALRKVREEFEELKANEEKVEASTPTQQTRIMMLLNGLNPSSGEPFTVEDFNVMESKAKSPEQRHMYKRIRAGHAGFGKAFDAMTAHPQLGTNIEDFHKKMDEFYIGLDLDL